MLSCLLYTFPAGCNIEWVLFYLIFLVSWENPVPSLVKSGGKKKKVLMANKKKSAVNTARPFFHALA